MCFVCQWWVIVYSVSVANALKEEETQICGIVVIHNMSDLGWRHLRNVDKKTFKVMLSILQVCELFCLVIVKLTITKFAIRTRAYITR
jgi:hypothetical protein